MQHEATEIKNGIREVATRKDIFYIVQLAERHRNECARHLDFSAEAIIESGHALLEDLERKNMNGWLYFRNGEPIGYAVAYNKRFMFSYQTMAQLEILYVVPEYRGSYGAVKLVKCFEAWARGLGAAQLYVGVARLDQDEARHIRKLFPKLNYDWAGTYFVKDTIK